MAGALAHEAHGELRASEVALQGGVDGDVNDPHRQRDARPSRGAAGPAVPAFGQVGEQARHRSGAPVCSASIPATSQRGGQGGTRLPDHPRQPPGHLERARRSGRARVGERSNQPGEDLSRDPYMSGLKCSVIEPPNTSAATCASVVQPACESRQA